MGVRVFWTGVKNVAMLAGHLRDKTVLSKV